MEGSTLSSPFLFLIGSLILLGIIWFIWKKRKESDFIPGPKDLGASDKSLRQFFSLVPVILGVHIAVSLIINGAQGRLFFSHNELKDIWSNWVGLTQIMIALALLYGGLTRPAAAVLGFLWLFGINLVGLVSTIKSIQYLGYAIFFYLAGRGPYAIDRMLFPILEPKEGPYILCASFFTYRRGFKSNHFWIH